MNEQDERREQLIQDLRIDPTLPVAIKRAALLYYQEHYGLSSLEIVDALVEVFDKCERRRYQMYEEAIRYRAKTLQ